jgi:hypothetical protein
MNYPATSHGQFLSGTVTDRKYLRKDLPLLASKALCEKA